MKRTSLGRAVLGLALAWGLACGCEEEPSPAGGDAQDDLGADARDVGDEGDAAPDDAREDAPEDTAQGNDAQELGDAADLEEELGPAPQPAPAEAVELGEFRVVFVPEEGAFRIEDRAGTRLLESVGAPQIEGSAREDQLGGYAPAAARVTGLKITTAVGAFLFERLGGRWTRYRVITRIERGQDGRSVTATLGEEEGGPEATLRFWLDERENLGLELQAPGQAGQGEQALRSLAFRCEEGERFYGLGSQSYAAEHRGWTVPIWTREQGIEKKERPLFPVNGQLEDAYAPMGWLMSSRGWGVLTGNSERSIFEICSEREDAWRLEVFSETLRMVLLRGASPKDLLRGLTEYTGRTPAPVPWTFAPWNDGLQSMERVEALAALLRERQIPSSAMWVEDWIGGEEGATGYHLHYVWYPDRERWPDLEGMIGRLRGQGFHFLGYFNPFVRQRTRLWDEAIEGGFLIHNPAGDPYVFTDPIFFQASLVDLTNPEAVAWLGQYQRQAIDLGLSGWMADYAEWLPFDAVMHDGTSGAEAHNLYPLLWQAANLSHLRQGRPEGDFTFFARSGFAWTEGGTSGLAPVVWGGDQNTSWDDNDGLRTVIPIGLNLGMSGVGIYAHDIAGYASALTPPTTKELWMRWTELGAFTPVMRTHHGAKDTANWALDRDEESIAHWKKYAVEHALLYPYLMSLAKEASEAGIPMFRHMALEFDGDEQAPTLRDQYMLGDALLVAPALDEGAQEVRVWLPAGLWASWWDFSTWQGPGWHTVPAPLGTIPVFLRPGALVPRLLEAPDTFADATDPEIMTLEDLGPDLELIAWYGGGATRTLADGTVITMNNVPLRDVPTAAEVQINGVETVACEAEPVAPCYDEATRSVWASGEDVRIAFTHGLELRLQGPARTWKLRLAMP